MKVSCTSLSLESQISVCDIHVFKKTKFSQNWYHSERRFCRTRIDGSVYQTRVVLSQKEDLARRTREHHAAGIHFSLGRQDHTKLPSSVAISSLNTGLVLGTPPLGCQGEVVAAATEAPRCFVSFPCSSFRAGRTEPRTEERRHGDRNKTGVEQGSASTEAKANGEA